MTQPCLTEILTHLPPGLADRLICHPPAAWEFRQVRLDWRDAALREAAAFLPGMSMKAAARKIEIAIRRHLAFPSAMRPPTPFAEAILRAATLNQNQALGAGQIGNVLRGSRQCADN
jgi:hypothetical protein